jgi:O-acetyl-ADP-ribose deacetylase
MEPKVIITQGDITRQKVDAVVNAANRSLLGGGGVDGAIHRAAGPDLLDECRALKGCETGQAKITRGYALPARWIIHTVGPIWRGGDHDEEALLASCYQNCFAIGQQQHLQSLAFPAISTGAYGFPLELATRIALRETQSHLVKDDHLTSIVFVCFDPGTRDCYRATAKELGLAVRPSP